MFDIQPKTLYRWYRNHLSDYKPDIEQGKWHPKYLEHVEVQTGEITRGKPLYVFDRGNIGKKMSIDDKAIGHEGFTIMSNAETGKIALMVESCKSQEVADALGLFAGDLDKVQSISCDMAAGYLSVCAEALPRANVVIDKFHVMQHVYDAVLDVRSNLKKKLAERLSKGKSRTAEDGEILQKIDVLKRCRYRLTQSADKWSEAGKEVMAEAFAAHKELQTAYLLSQHFKSWYSKENCTKPITTIASELHEWYREVKLCGVPELNSTVRMIRKHEDEIINFFHGGQTSARAERLNGKVNRFIAGSYGVKDKDFAPYRIANYFL